VARQPHYYEPLRDAQREALENAEAAPLPTETESPTRPTEHPGQRVIWGDDLSLVSQTTLAEAQVKQNWAEREAAVASRPEGVASAQAETAKDQQPEQREASATVNPDNIEMTDARMARAALLANLAESQAQDRDQTPEEDYSQDR
jgi:hypothetical protein